MDDLKLGKVGVDPLTLGPEAGRVLYDRCRKQAGGFPFEAVRQAGANMIINAIRQKHATRKAALDEFDALAARCRAVLAEHYDSSGGKRRSIFPFHQTVHIPLMSDKDLKRY